MEEMGRATWNANGRENFLEGVVVEKYAGGGGPLVLVGAAGIIYYFVV